MYRPNARQTPSKTVGRDVTFHLNSIQNHPPSAQPSSVILAHPRHKTPFVTAVYSMATSLSFEGELHGSFGGSTCGKLFVERKGNEQDHNCGDDGKDKNDTGMLSCPVFALDELVELLLAEAEGVVERGHLVVVPRSSSSGSRDKGDKGDADGRTRRRWRDTRGWWEMLI